ncbi:hypothetical protein V1511DRAFT_536341 [Dipodascopsis uninucleata]
MSTKASENTENVRDGLDDLVHHNLSLELEQSLREPTMDLSRTRQNKAGNASKSARIMLTPSTKVFRDRTNDYHKAINSKEFTPLLRSAIKNSAAGKMHSTDDVQFPGSISQHQASPGLPLVGIDDVSASMEDITRTSLKGIDVADSNSTTPVVPRNSGGELLTLREQEKAIDEIKKENFSLKLRIYFLMQQIEKTTPEAFQGTVKENAEMKAEQAAMKRELHILKKQLQDSEEKAHRLTFDIASDLSTSDSLTQEEKHRLDQLLHENKQAADNLFDAQSEITKLQREMEEYKLLLEQSDAEQNEVEELKAILEQLEGEIESLKVANRTLSENLEKKIQQLESAEAELGEANLEIQQLRDTIAYLEEDNSSENTISSEAKSNMLKDEVEKLTEALEKARLEVEESHGREIRAVNDLEKLLNSSFDNNLSGSEGLSKINEDLKARNKELKEELKVLRDKNKNSVDQETHKFELDVAKQQIEDLQMTITELNQLIESDQRDVTTMTNTSSLKLQLTETKQSLIHCQNQISSLTQSLRLKDEEIDTLRSQLRHSKLSENTLTGDNSTSLRQLLNEEADLRNQAQKRADRLSTKNMELNKELSQLQRMLSQLEIENDDLKIKASSGMKTGSYSLDAVKAEREQLKIQLTQARAELEVAKELARSNEAQLRDQLKGLKREREELQQTALEAEKDRDEAKRLYDRKLRSTITESVRRDRTNSSSLQYREREVIRLQSQLTELEGTHRLELNALAMQIRYLKAKSDREKNFRLDSAFLKRFFLLQINSFESCNKANLYLLEQMGIYPERKYRNRRPKLKSVVCMVVAAIRMRNLSQQWSEHQQQRNMLSRSLQSLRINKGIRESMR